MQEQQEEKIYGQMNPEQAEELYKLLETKVDTEEKEDVARQIRRFMRKHHLPFLATDRIEFTRDRQEHDFPASRIDRRRKTYSAFRA